ncbi:MAG: AmmeMemoRadiSam system protein A [Rugosibacter sp.]|nr:AmmeMemoRadiSam system protein A [Rugosibacter sp.]
MHTNIAEKTDARKTRLDSGAATAAEKLGGLLLPIARAAIASALGQPGVADESLSRDVFPETGSNNNPLADAPRLHQPGASFVTLTQNGALRGCIGTLEAHRTLLADIKANAMAAAFRDPRFAPLQAAELDITEIEVSLLSAIQPIEFNSEREALEALRPGMDGVVLEYRHYRSTFLPQVWEQLPTPELFLAHLKNKAGLPTDFWAGEVRLSIYGVSKWKEPSR